MRSCLFLHCDFDIYVISFVRCTHTRCLKTLSLLEKYCSFLDYKNETFIHLLHSNTLYGDVLWRYSFMITTELLPWIVYSICFS